MASATIPPLFPCLKLLDELEELGIPDGLDIPEHKRFFPKSSLKKLCTEERIQEVLRCWCPRCQNQRYGIQTNSSQSLKASIRCQGNAYRGITVLFSLLVFIKCPCLIHNFLDQDVRDHELETGLMSITTDYVQQRFFRKEGMTLARRFNSNKYKFFVPFMRSDTYQEYPSSTILPFINEIRIGRQTETGKIINEGSNATVTVFEIFNEYQNFSVSHSMSPKTCRIPS